MHPVDVALVLGAGGPVGHAFHAAVLAALAEGCDWDARTADLIVGTSAGAQAGALLRAGLSPRDMLARVTGEPLSPVGASIARLLQHPPLPKGTRQRGPSSWAYLRRALRRPWRARPGRLIAALLPEGNVASEQVGHAFTRLFGLAWPAPPLWIPAVHLDSGARVVFGRPGAPRVDVGTAVRCSSAVPGLRRPVRLGDDRFVDGGIASATHLDLVTKAALVIVLSPLSRVPLLKHFLHAEIRRLHRRGQRVVVFEPDADTAAVMGWNFLDARLAPAVARAAYRGARSRLERDGRLRALLAHARTRPLVA
jgi:NTE family protein